jgi:hypothetical protein
MRIEDRIRTTVDGAVDELCSRIDREMRAILDEATTSAAAERELAIAATREKTLADAADETRRQIAEVESRERAVSEQAVTAAREEERAQARTLRDEADAAGAQRLGDALALAASSAADAATAADLRMRDALAAAESRAATQTAAAVDEARRLARSAESAAVSRLLDSVRGLDGASSLTEVLDVLGQAVGREAPRAAVLVLRNERLLGWKLSGFGAADGQPKSIDIGLKEGGILGRCVAIARPVSTRHNQADGGPGFAQLSGDGEGVVAPVIVGGRVVAVVYADTLASEGRGFTGSDAWPDVIDLLARHAARCLEALTVQRTAVAPSPRFWAPPPRQGATA